MSVRGGRLDKRMALQRASTAQDAHGQPVDAWTTFATRWCGLEAIGESERFTEGEEHAHAARRIVMRHDRVTALLKERDRIVYADRLFDVQGSAVVNDAEDQLNVRVLERRRDEP